AAILSLSFLVSAIDATSTDLGVHVSDAPDPVMVGGNLHYMITVTNNGPDSADGVTVDDAVAAQVSYGSAVPSQGTCNGSSVHVTCELGTVPEGGTATVLILVAPIAHGMLSDTATVSASDNMDPFSGNDTVFVHTIVNGPDCTIFGTWGDDSMSGT